MFALALLFAQTTRPHAVEVRLRAELAGLASVQFGRDNETLIVKYRTEVVMAPKMSMAAKVKKEMAPMERPTPIGFKLETYEFDHSASEPQRPEQAVRTNPNWLADYGKWKVDAVERQVDGQNRGRYYYLEWGSKANPKMIQNIRAILEKGTRPMVNSRS